MCLLSLPAPALGVPQKFNYSLSCVVALPPILNSFLCVCVALHCIPPNMLEVWPDVQATRVRQKFYWCSPIFPGQLQSLQRHLDKAVCIYWCTVCTYPNKACLFLFSVYFFVYAFYILRGAQKCRPLNKVV